jgi:hypothetical protein
MKSLKKSHILITLAVVGFFLVYFILGNSEDSTKEKPQTSNLDHSTPHRLPFPYVEPVVTGPSDELKFKYCSILTYLADTFHTYATDKYGPFSGPFLTQISVTDGRLIHPEQYSTYGEFMYLNAYECTKDSKYLNWTVEYLDWTWKHQMENDLQAEYNASADTIHRHLTDSVPHVMYITAMAKAWYYTGEPRFKNRMARMANAYWLYQVNKTTKIPHWQVNTTTLKVVSPHYWRDFDKWLVAPLLQEAYINDNLTHKQYVRDFVESLRRSKYPTGLPPTSIESDGFTYFGDGRGPITEYFRAFLGAQAFLEVYAMTSDPYYLNEAEILIDAVDKYMWREDLGRHISIVWSENGKPYNSTTGQPVGLEYGYMDPTALAAYAMAYRYTKNANKKAEYLRKARLEMDFVFKNQWTNGVPCKFDIAFNGSKLPKDTDTNCRFPDVELAAYGYMYYYIGDVKAKEYFIRTLEGITPYKKRYGMTQSINTITNESAAQAWYEYQFMEYLNEALIRAPIYRR